ncbi:MAG: DUF4838 domain-containing protein [Bacteroides sp.]|nr:DUF4838 domain-containing protein [Bacteroides sp.]MCM1412897.1 DUF4838 domain-containing protein [Bacteroides sp.]MCM1471566.1 DUF4838 domain-containing protein [Bacteroides sp.]
MKRLTLLAAALVTIACALGQATIVKNHRAAGRIICTDTIQQPGATLLQDFVERIANVKLPVVTGKVAPRKGDVVFSLSDNKAIKEDGFKLSTLPGWLTIESRDRGGAVYGVVTLLEDYLGCNYWSEFDFSAPKQATIALPRIDRIDNPAFRYRQSQNYALRTDPIYRQWMRLEEPTDEFAGGYWVHTFNRLLPAARYGESHPEYYAWFDGARHPGQAGQWCLTNDEVFEIVCQQVDSVFKANPGLNMISVSQNDGNYTNCRCETCMAIDSVEGSPSGTIIHFLNRLADRFPDKQFSTLAYLYTMHPPKHVKPRPNVNIMLCSIDCYREVPMQYNTSGRDFLSALEGWAKISDNIFVWDYGINFDGTTTPFPNFHVIQPNIQTFRDNNVKMHFSQIAGYRGGDMSELRTWLISKLMWNPDADVDSLTNTFLNGYYGAAAPYMQQYLKLMEGALLGSRTPLWIYDSPLTHKDGMLNEQMRMHYNDLFDRAEQAVAADSALLARVQRSRLSLQYSELEIERSNPNKNPARISEMLDTFDTRTARFGLASLNERNNTPHEYVSLYRQRYLPRDTKNLAAGADITFSTPLSAPYDRLGAPSLTDGLFGGTTYKDSWIGWEGIDVDMTVDLGSVKEIRSIDTDFLQQLGSWILQPKSVTYSISTDGTTWTTLPRHELAEDRDPKVKFVSVKEQFDAPTAAKYIKVSVEGTKQCPGWHYGVGNPCWFFLDEITVE